MASPKESYSAGIKSCRSEQTGIASILERTRNLGINKPLHSYATTALGASEVTLLELANAYGTIASGTRTQPHVIREIVLDSGAVLAKRKYQSSPVDVEDDALSLIQEGLRGVVRMPGGTARRTGLPRFPVRGYGKDGNDKPVQGCALRGSTYGPEGITVAVRIGFDDNRSLGGNETGGRVALRYLRDCAQRVWREAGRACAAVPG